VKQQVSVGKTANFVGDLKPNKAATTNDPITARNKKEQKEIEEASTW